MRKRLLLLIAVVYLASACSTFPVRDRDYRGPQVLSLKVQGELAGEVLHYAATKAKRPGQPILLLPDVFENAKVFDLEGRGLAPYLAGAGYDVYVPATRPATEAPCFEDRMDQALLPILAALRERTGASVTLVAHGVSGLASLVVAAHGAGREQVRGIVAIGAPGRLFLGNGIFDALIEAEKTWPSDRPIHTAAGARMPAPYPGTEKSVLDVLLTNDKNFDPSTRKAYYRQALEPLPRALARQLIRWLQTQTLQSADGERDWAHALKDVVCPVLFVTGKVDNVIDPLESIEAMKAIGSTDKQIRIFGVSNRYAVDYGHVGLLLGPEAHKEVFPIIRSWLDDRRP